LYSAQDLPGGAISDADVMTHIMNVIAKDARKADTLFFNTAEFQCKKKARIQDPFAKYRDTYPYMESVDSYSGLTLSKDDINTEIAYLDMNEVPLRFFANPMTNEVLGEMLQQLEKLMGVREAHLLDTCIDSGKGVTGKLARDISWKIKARLAEKDHIANLVSEFSMPDEIAEKLRGAP
jgi:hypothetical protein